jgi:hypothetical protein
MELVQRRRPRRRELLSDGGAVLATLRRRRAGWRRVTDVEVDGQHWTLHRRRLLDTFGAEVAALDAKRSLRAGEARADGQAWRWERPRRRAWEFVLSGHDGELRFTLAGRWFSRNVQVIASAGIPERSRVALAVLGATAVAEAYERQAAAAGG